MGQCAAVCANSSKKVDEVVVDSLGDTMQKYSRSPYYPKVIYIQLRFKKYLKKKKNIKQKSTANSNRKKANNINVNINLNVNMNNINQGMETNQLPASKPPQIDNND